jgi:hypothetical protein
VERPVCSAKGCRADATHAVVWNNPKIHTPDREKVWHACDEHLEHLSQYVGVRGFLLRTEPLGTELPDADALLPEAPEEAPEDPALPG